MSCNHLPEHNFAIFKGDDESVKFRYKADGEAVDITGYTIQLETNVDSLSKEAVIADPTSGEFVFNFTQSDTSDLENKRVKYKVVFYPNGLAGTKETKFGGSINLNSKDIA